MMKIAKFNPNVHFIHKSNGWNNIFWAAFHQERMISLPTSGAPTSSSLISNSYYLNKLMAADFSRTYIPRKGPLPRLWHDTNHNSSETETEQIFRVQNVAGFCLMRSGAAVKSDSQPCLWDQLLASVWDQRLSQSSPLHIAGLWKHVEKCSLARESLPWCFYQFLKEQLPSGLDKLMEGVQALKQFGGLCTQIPELLVAAGNTAPSLQYCEWMHACYFFSMLWASMVQICFLLIWVTDRSYAVFSCGANSGIITTATFPFLA